MTVELSSKHGRHDLFVLKIFARMHPQVHSFGGVHRIPHLQPFLYSNEIVRTRYMLKKCERYTAVFYLLLKIDILSIYASPRWPPNL